MLCELRVENLLLIEEAQLRLASGLNALTGETGAGKTVLAHALDLLMGGRARSGVVRPGAREAYVEGAFSVKRGLMRELGEALPECAGLEESEEEAGGELVLGRRVAQDGRTRAYVNGRAASVGDLRALGSRLISFYGQHEHRKLMLSDAQLEVLDRVCGVEHMRAVRECAAAYARVREIEDELERLLALGQERERELALLEHEIAEIEQAQPEEREYGELLARRERVRRLDALRAASGAAGEALAGERSEGLGAAQLIATASAQLSAMAGADARLDELGERCQALVIEAQDVAGELRSYREDLEGEDGSLVEVEERLQELERLMRKHGGTIGSVLAHLQHARARREALTSAEHARDGLQRQLTDAREALGGLVAKLRATRRRAARKLERAVREQLGALAMGEATFDVALAKVAPRASGGDEVQFVIAPNPGVPAAPLREIASGGELSRVMLALATVSAAGQSGPGRDPAGRGSADAAEVDEDSTLVFDEIDAGIGGHTARAVGERLRAVAKGRQVLCITHLPQIASLADRHFSVVKHSEGGAATTTSVVQLGDAQVLSELVRMLGADEQDAGARRHARELLRAA